MAQEPGPAGIKDPYEGLYLADGVFNFGDYIQNNTFGLKRLYNYAAKGQNVLNDSTVSMMAGEAVTYSVGHPQKDPNLNALQPDINILAAGEQQKFNLGEIDPREQDIFDQAKLRLAKNAGLEALVIDSELKIIEQDYYANLAYQRNYFGTTSGGSNGLSRSIGDLLIKQFQDGKLSPDDDAQLARLEKDYSKDFAPGVLEQETQTFRSRLAERFFRQEENTKDELTDFAADAAYGETIKLEGQKTVIILPESNSDTWGLSSLDPPKVKNPANQELNRLAVGVHEGEHNQSHLSEGQPAETVSDEAVMQMLNEMIDGGDAQAAAFKDWILKARDVSAMQGEIRGVENFHDDAIYLHVFEQTGRMLDFNKAAASKSSLIDRVRDKLDVKAYQKDGIVYNNDVMGAVADVMRDGKLTPAQMAQAQSYLNDAAALGYEENSNYRKVGVSNPFRLAPTVINTPSPKPAG